MRWTVVWLPQAEQELADIWTNSTDQSKVALATYEIETLLRFNPSGVGGSRDDGRRDIIRRPLGAVYKLFPQDRIVQVQRVWKLKP